mmetsp:Transcript_44052/g.87403  ORF Transcript_44052/g.87403 Transcript_44052/m.87403 type:complete len:209 (-) Transcript_44052:30-656(-)
MNHFLAWSNQVAELSLHSSNHRGACFQKPQSLVEIPQKSGSFGCFQGSKSFHSRLWMCFAGFSGLHHRASKEHIAELSLQRSNNLGMHLQKPQNRAVIHQQSRSCVLFQRTQNLLANLSMCSVGFFGLQHRASEGREWANTVAPMLCLLLTWWSRPQSKDQCKSSGRMFARNKCHLLHQETAHEEEATFPLVRPWLTCSDKLGTLPCC